MWKDYKYDTYDSDFAGTTLALPRCYESHPVLKLGTGKLYGGSASYPLIKDADVYVALQQGSTSGRASDPWDKQRVVEVHYSISDMQAPKDVARFTKLVTWLCNQLHEGKTVHVGCIGGHGRTGTVFSAIVAEFLGEKDAIQYVRTHYCDKAVESKEQVQFLVKHYGVTDAKPTKSYETKLYDPPGKTTTRIFPDWLSKGKTVATVTRKVPEGVTSKTRRYEPLASSLRSLWKAKKH